MRYFSLSIGQLSDQIGVNVETIRYYEKIGLMPKPQRTGGGHRVYDIGQSERLAFIKRGRELGFSLDDIRALLGIGDERPRCGEVQKLTEHHLENIRRKILDLQSLETTLAEIASKCKGGSRRKCPVIDALSFDRNTNI